MKDVFTVTSVAKKFPYRGYYYSNLPMHILRNEHLTETQIAGRFGADSISLESEFLARQCFTKNEAEELRRNLKKTYKKNIVEVIIEPVEVPSDLRLAPSDTCGYGGGSDGYMFYADNRWPGLPVLGFYDVYERELVSKYSTYTFDANGNASLPTNCRTIEAKHVKKMFKAYNRALKTGKEVTYEVERKIKPVQPRTDSQSIPF